MPDLSHEASLQYWNQYNDPTIYRVIVFLESAEDWTLDGDPDLETAMTSLGNKLESIDKINFRNLGHEADFVKILSQIKTSRGLRLLQAVDMVQPGSASRIINYAHNNVSSSNDANLLFINRNTIFERLRILYRIFSKERFDLIERAINGDET